MQEVMSSRRGPYTSLASLSRSFTEAMVNVLVFLWRMSCLLALWEGNALASNAQRQKSQI